MNPIYAQLARQQREQHPHRHDVHRAASLTASGAPGAKEAFHILFGRDDEVDALYRILNHKKGGRSSVAIVHGDGSCGKSTLVHRGLIPRFRGDFPNVFQSVSWVPSAGDDYVATIEGLVTTLFAQLPTGLDPDAAQAENERRCRHFGLLIAGDSGEAAEYLAALFREAHANDGPADSARCLLFFDQFDRFFPGGLVADAPEEWIENNLLPLVGFLYDLALTNAFPLVLAVRSFNVDGLKQVLSRSPRRMTIDWLPIDPPPPSSLSELVTKDVSLPAIEPELVTRCEELLAAHPGALAFIEDTLRAQASLEPPPLSLEFFETERPLEKIIAGVAEAAAAPLSEAADGENGFYQLMNLFFPVPDGDAPIRAVHLPFSALAERPALATLAEALISARVLYPGGDCHENASIAWSVPRFFRYWERGFAWLQHDRDLRESAQRLESKVAAWEEAERTAVLLLHGSASLEDARELLDYDADRPCLSEAMREYLNVSFETDRRLHQGKSSVKAPTKGKEKGNGKSQHDATDAAARATGGLRGWFRSRKGSRNDETSGGDQ